MKILKIILASLSALSYSLGCGLVLLCSHMQDHYKTQIPAPTEITNALLEKKRFWAHISETKPQIFLGCCIGFLISFLIVVVVDWVTKSIHR